MSTFPFLKLTEPSDEEMAIAADTGHEIVAISTVNSPDRMFLKLLCRNGEEAVVWLDAFLVDHLARHFDKVLQGGDARASQPLRTKFATQESSSLGVVPRDDHA